MKRLLQGIGSLVLLAYFAKQASTNAKWTEVVLVNGLQRTYLVHVDGRRMQLAPGEPQRLELSSKEKIRVDADFGTRRETFEVDLSSEGRGKVLARTVVLNPDRLAKVVEERRIYIRGNSGPEPAKAEDRRVFSGREIYRFESIDFPFVHFASHVAGKGRWRSRTGLRAEKETPEQLLLRAGSIAGEEKELLVRRYLELVETGEAERIRWLSLLSAPRFAALAAADLERHPAAVPWHRAYQQLPDQRGRAAELAAEYRDRLAAHPGDAGWLYLLAKVVADPGEAQRLLELAAKGPSPSPWANHDLAWSELQAGRFTAARTWARHGREAAPGNAELRRLEAILAVATGDFAAAIAAGDELDPRVLHALLARTGQVEVSAAMPPPPHEAGSPNTQWERERFAETGFCHPHGLACFAESLAGQDSALARFWLGLIRRDGPLATDNFPAEDPLAGHLLMAVVFAGAADGDYHRLEAAELLAARAFGGGAAPALRGEPFRPEELMESALPLEYKPAILYLAGRATGDGRLFELARRLNFLPDLGQLLLDREMAAAASRGA